MELENIILSEVSQAQKTKNRVFPHMWTLDQGKHNKGTGLWSHDKAKAHNEGMRIGKKPKKKNKKQKTR
jgi:hypothetical protein